MTTAQPRSSWQRNEGTSVSQRNYSCVIPFSIATCWPPISPALTTDTVFGGGCVHIGDRVSTLQAANADLHHAKKDGTTPLIVAAHTGQADMCRFLIENGGVVEETKMDGSTAFFASIQEGSMECAQVLIAAGANPHTPRRDGITPLIIAAYTGRLPFVQFLTEECDADVNAQSNHGTALTLAQKQNMVEVAMYLQSKGAEMAVVTQTPSQLEAQVAMQQAAQAQMQGIMAMMAQMQAAGGAQ